jgi:hypothetical protein
MTIAGDIVPSARASVSTHSGAKAGGGAIPAVPIAVFGVTAVAATDNGVVALAGSNAMSIRKDGADASEVAYGSTTDVYDIATVGRSKGAGQTHAVFSNRWARAWRPGQRLSCCRCMRTPST